VLLLTLVAAGSGCWLGSIFSDALRARLILIVRRHSMENPKQVHRALITMIVTSGIGSIGLSLYLWDARPSLSGVYFWRIGDGVRDSYGPLRGNDMAGVALDRIHL